MQGDNTKKRVGERVGLFVVGSLYGGLCRFLKGSYKLLQVLPDCQINQ